MEKIFVGENIWKKYGAKDILKYVSLHVYRGEIYGLLGENGAGKTSLLKIIAKLIPKTRYLGHVQYGKSGRIFSLIGSPSCYLDLSVEENLKLCTILSKENKREQRKRMIEVIEMFDMAHFLKKKGKNLSLGMLQKLRLACAFLSTANLLILDEPWNGLDIKSVISLRKAILDAVKKYKKTIILTGHDISEMERLCDRFGILVRGELVEFSKKDQVYDSSLESYYIALLKGGRKA